MPRYILQENLISDADGGPPFADISTANLLADSSLDPSFYTWPANPTAPRRRVFWSGWMGDSTFALDHRTWSKEAWVRLDRWCDAAIPHLQRNNAIAVLRPHSRHVLSDPQSCFTFLKRRAAVVGAGGQPFELLLDPVAFLTLAMIPRAEDHLTRAMDALADHPAVSAVVISNLEPSIDDPDLLNPVLRGVLTDPLITLITTRVPVSKPIITLS